MIMGSKRAKQVVRRANRSTERLRILLAGESASGKTTSFLTIPAALRAVGVSKPKIVLIDFDQNADDLIDHEGFEVYRFGGIPGSDPETYPAADWWMKNMAPKLEGVHVFIVDSITALSMATLATVAADNNRLGKMPQLQDWNAEMHATQQLVLDMQNLHVSHAVITSIHTYLDKDDLSGRAYNRLVLTGKLPNKLIRLFPEIYFANTGVARQPKFVWQTIPDIQTKCRTMMPKFRVDGGVEQDFGPIFKEWFKGDKRCTTLIQ